MSNTVFIDAVRKSEFLSNVQNKNLSFFWELAQVLYDEPGKIEQHEDNSELHLRSRLDPLINGTQREVIIVSPYLIPGEDDVEKIRNASERGVKFRILTNSLASTDVPLVHSSYSPYRRSLIEAGADLYEMKPTYRSKDKTKLMDVSSRATLHSKIYIFDRKNVFVGSYNLDPRSTKLNTEMGIYVVDTKMAELFASWWEQYVEKLAFKLSLQYVDNNPDSDPSLLWTDLSQDPVKVYEDEPLVGTWEKIKSGFFSIWPIEGQL